VSAPRSSGALHRATLGRSPTAIRPTDCLCYNEHMDRTIRNLDEDVYRQLKARAALRGATVGELMNEAIRAWLARPEDQPGRRSLADLQPEPYPDGNERLSEEIDAVAYGA